MQHQPLGVIGLGGYRAHRSEIQLAVYIVFDQRNVVACKQLDQLPLFLIGHQAAQRVLELRHQPAGARRMTLDGGLHRVQVDAGARMRRYFQRLQSMALKRLQGAIERGGLDHDRVAGLRDRLQAEIQRFQRAVGDDDVAGRHVDAADQVAQRDLAAQAGIARRQVFHRVQRILALEMHGHGLGQPRQRKQQRGREGGAQRRHVAVAHRAEDVEDAFADRELRRFSVRTGGAGFGRQGCGRGVDVIAGARLRPDQAARFQQIVGLEHRRRTEAARRARVPHGGQLVARAQYAVADRLGDLGGQSFIQAQGAAGRCAPTCCFAGSPWPGVP